MVMTTLLFSLAIWTYFKLNITLSLLFFLFFAGVDLCFFAAVIFKIPNGGWVSLTIAVILATSMMCWTYGEYKLSNYLTNKYVSTSIEDLSAILANSGIISKQQSDEESTSNDNKTLVSYSQVVNISVGTKDTAAARVPGLGIFLTETLDRVPKSFDMFVEKAHGIPEILVFLQIQKKLHPVVNSEKRYKIQNYEGEIYTIIVNVGFAETSLPIHDIVLDALLNFNPNVEDKMITFYINRHIIKIIESNIFYKVVLMVYSFMKDFFPNTYSGVKIDQNYCVIVNFLCPL